ncbi:MAG: hypothetical protein IPM33_09720 [Phycisphaerales bacterium]|nr:hypothetical protein [Phycisphaerales bacterium]
MNVFELILFLMPAASAYWVVTGHGPSSNLAQLFVGGGIAALSYICIFRAFSLPAFNPDRRREARVRPIPPLLFWLPIALPLLALLLIPLLTRATMNQDSSLWLWSTPAACAWLSLILVNEGLNHFITKMDR